MDIVAWKNDLDQTGGDKYAGGRGHSTFMLFTVLLHQRFEIANVRSTSMWNSLKDLIEN